MAIKYEDLAVQVSKQHIEFIKGLESMGAIGACCFSHEGHRLVKSMEPAGPNEEYIFHVSVSHESGRKVKPKVAIKYAKVLVPAVKKWETEIGNGVIHLWQDLA